MTDLYLMKEQELIKLNKELDLRNKFLENQLKSSSKQLKRECSLKRAEHERSITNENFDSCNNSVESKKSVKSIDKPKIKNVAKTPISETAPSNTKTINECIVENATNINASLEAEIAPVIVNHNNNNNKITQVFTKPIRQQKSHATQTAIITPIKDTTNSVPENLQKRNISTEGLIKFLKSKITVLQDEYDKIQKDSSKKIEELQVSFELQKQLECQRDQAIIKNNSMQLQLTKMEERSQENELKLKDRDKEVLSLKRELELCRKEAKTSTQSNSNLEKRLARLQEELENTKKNLLTAQEMDKEHREKSRMDMENLERQIKQLRKHRMDLITTYKKQLMLIDNLKRQNFCLEQAKLVDIAEKEFIKILDFNCSK